MLLTSAKQQGALEPLIDFLEDQIGLASDSIEPEGAEWPYKRAYRDGMLGMAQKTLEWLQGRTNYSPDVAQNTEE